MVLAGIRVLDVGSYVAGPAAATVMGDFGAEVIKIEPPEGDPYRSLHRLPGSPVGDRDYYWVLDSRNKKSVVLDLKRPEARDALERLVRSADVFLTNMPLDVRARLGIRWADLEPLNERLVYASLTAYGESGPEANKTGFDATAWWARTGLMDNVRSAPDAPPARSIPGMGDHATAMALFGAVMMALYQRERTGKGGMVSTSLMAAGLWSNAMYVQAHLCGAAVRQRPPREQALNALGNMYRCGDDRWFILAALSEERQWPGFVRALDRPDLAEDPRFATLGARRKHVHGLVADARRDLRDAPVGRVARATGRGGHHVRRDREARGSGRGPADAGNRSAHAARGSGRRGRAHREQPGVLRGRDEGGAGARAPPRRAHGRSLAELWVRRSRDRSAAARGRRGGLERHPRGPGYRGEARC